MKVDGPYPQDRVRDGRQRHLQRHHLHHIYTHGRHVLRLVVGSILLRLYVTSYYFLYIASCYFLLLPASPARV